MALAEWKARIGHERAEDIRNQAIERGIGYDQQVQDHIAGKPIAHKGLQIFLQDNPPAKTERTIYNEELGFKGRYDCISEVPTRYKTYRLLIDFKGASRKKQPRHIQDEMLQLTAYWLTLESMGEKIDYAMLLFILPYNQIQERHLYRDARDRNKVKLIERIKHYYEAHNLGPIGGQNGTDGH